ncbi:MAG TPA: hypothetical protein PKH51_13570, partial [Candidatus Sumerlaeota bacterium]|nr:hypothetical protein [Candidatus Sumerlaeota bacterium]
IETIPSPMDAKETVKKLKDNIPGVPAGYVLRLGRRNFIDPTTMQVDRSKSIDDLIYMVRSDVPLGGERLRRAVVYTDPTELSDPVMVSISFDNEGGRIFKDITTDHTGESFAIILDDVVYSAPNIREPIVGGSASISGGFSQSEAQDLAVVLKAGALPAPLRVISQNTIGPTLGADSIRDSGKAVIIGGILIIIMMVSIYRTAGFVAVLAMFLNVLLIMAILALMNATLTLSGIGGIRMHVFFAIRIELVDRLPVALIRGLGPMILVEARGVLERILGDIQIELVLVGALLLELAPRDGKQLVANAHPSAKRKHRVTDSILAAGENQFVDFAER